MRYINKDPVLEIQSLSYSYGAVKALTNISCKLFPGEFKVLLGPNGAGKTTMFSLLTRLLVPSIGTINLFGRSLAKAPEDALAKMGVVFQQPTLDLDLTVRQNLHYHASLHGLNSSIARTRMETELKRLNMETQIDKQVRSLNSGHRRRVEITRALLHRPLFLLLDEPTVGLDVPTRRDIVNHVHNLAQDKGIAVLWATHLIDEIKKDDTVIILNKGILCADNTSEIICNESNTNNISEAFEKFIADPKT
ncbi:MAG: ABC transporter ATP-binding protein NatA [Alphaproteobacteria bacterium MarineAlpha3_Bin5]|nr:ABC transporter ATP-binding protein [Magnetovibrio sp.]PPR76075.1 MAG: ABC transporter ATP-binding protein NatA [Alphaproteobacteria bacterium MarineAlpha3_Bin5]|tara:strand:- start:802 stop:1551 length:750 start_codon:yes stop_codon:yes gene_type:complete